MPIRLICWPICAQTSFTIPKQPLLANCVLLSSLCCQDVYPSNNACVWGEICSHCNEAEEPSLTTHTKEIRFHRILLALHPNVHLNLVLQFSENNHTIVVAILSADRVPYNQVSTYIKVSNPSPLLAAAVFLHHTVHLLAKFGPYTQ